MSRQKLINIKISQLNNKLIKIESNGGIGKRTHENGKPKAKLHVNEYTDEDIEIVIGLFIHQFSLKLL